MKVLVTSRAHPHPWEAHAGFSELHPVSAEDADVASLADAKQVVVGVSDALVSGGWLESDLWKSLIRRHESGDIRMLAVQIGLAPCALVPSTVPLVSEVNAGRALASESDLGERPATARYPDPEQVAATERAAASTALGESEPPSPASSLTPGSYIDGSLRLLYVESTDASFEHWVAEAREHGCLAQVSVLHPHVADLGPSLQEAVDAARSLNHPNIARILADGQLVNGRRWVARERVSGATLTQLVEAGGSRASLLLAVLDAEAGIAAAHEAGLIHGALHPDCVRVRDGGVAVVTDFAVGALASSGSPVYAAPERLDPSLQPAVGLDVYGLGMLALLALYRQPLPYWVMRDVTRLIDQLDAPESLRAVLTRCVDWAPEVRPIAAGALRAAVEADPTLLRQVTGVVLLQERDELAEELIAVLASSPDHAPEVATLRTMLARSRASRGDPATAVAALSRLAEDTRNPAPLWLEIAEIQRDNGLDGAVESWERALEGHSTRDHAMTALRGLIQADSERFLRWGRALALYAEGEELGQIASRLGRAFHEQGSDSSALLWLDRAAATGMEDPELLRLREDLRTARGDWGDVVELMRHEAEAGPGPSVELLERAARLARRATPDPESVAALYQQLLELDPTHAEARRHLARSAMNTGDTEAALEHFAALCSTAAAKPADHVALARLRMSADQLDEALDSACSALEGQPHHTIALRLARRAAQDLGRFPDAAGFQARLMEFEASSEGHSHADRLVRLGNLHRFGGNAPAAVEAYDEAIAYSPSQLDAWWGLYTLERARLKDSTRPPAPLRFGPHEALARVFADVLEPDSARSLLASDTFGQGLSEAVDWETPSSWAAAVVDLLRYRAAIGAQFFDRLMDAFPQRVSRIAVVRNLWSGAAQHIASFPIASAQLWSDDGPDFDSELQRELVFCGSWPTEHGWFDDERAATLFTRDAPLDEVAEEDLDDDEDLMLDAPETLFVCIGDGPSASRHEIDSSVCITPEMAPALSNPLQISKHGDRIYISVAEGLLRLDETSAEEFKVAPGDLLLYGDIPIEFVRDASPLPIPVAADADPETPTEESLIAPLLPRPVAELDSDCAALLWEQGDQMVGLSLEPPEVVVVERVDGSLEFSTEEQPVTLAIIVHRSGMHFVEQELTNASGFAGSLSARQLYSGEVLSIGGGTFQYRAAAATGSVLPMPKPSLAVTRPTLMLQDGSPKGQPVPLGGDVFQIGRGRTCELQIRTDGLLSRVHCIVREIDDSFYLEDAGSSNGTRLNGDDVRALVKLTEGDLIEIGVTELRFTRTPPMRSLVPIGSDEDEPAAVDPVEAARQEDAEIVISRPAQQWTDAECVEKVRIANLALQVLFAALDKPEGSGRGRSMLQLLVDARAHDQSGLLDGLELHDATLPDQFLLEALQSRPVEDRRPLLNRVLMTLIDQATDRVCDLIPEDSIEAVLSELSNVGHRKHLRR